MNHNAPINRLLQASGWSKRIEGGKEANKTNVKAPCLLVSMPVIPCHFFLVFFFLNIYQISLFSTVFNSKKYHRRFDPVMRIAVFFSCGWWKVEV